MPDWAQRRLSGSAATYWELDYRTVTNMQWSCTPQDPSLPIFREPHACVAGTVCEVLHEGDGDVHVWMYLDGTSKQHFAVEITPQQKLPPPKVGEHIRAYGIYRYDLAHGWPELHPCDGWELIPGS